MTNKISKVQKEFFGKLLEDTVVTIVAQIAQDEYKEQLPAVAGVILKQSLAEGKLDQAVSTVAEAMLAKVDFKTLKKVDAFMKSDDFVKVIQATHEVVFQELRGELMELVAAVAEVSEKAIKAVSAEAEDVEALSTEGEQAA